MIVKGGQTSLHRDWILQWLTVTSFSVGCLEDLPGDISLQFLYCFERH